MPYGTGIFLQLQRSFQKMVFNVELLTCVGTCAVFAYQVTTGLWGLREKASLRSFQLFLFLMFLSSELSRSFFPIFASGLAHGPADRALAAALPQVLWGLSALIATPGGWLLAKKIGSKKVLVLSAAVTAAALAATAASGNYWVMLVSRSLVSAGYGIVNIVAVMYLSGKGLSARNVSVLLAAIATSSICGNSLGGLLAGHLSYGEIFCLSALSSVLAIGMLRLSVPGEIATPPAKKDVPYRHLLSNWKIQCFAVLNTMPYRFVLTGFVLYLIPVVLTARGVEQRWIGQVMMAYFLLGYLLVKPVARFLDQFLCYRSVALASTVATGVGLLLFARGLDSTLATLTSIVVIAVGMAMNSSIQVPVVPLVFKGECDQLGRETLLAYFRTVERIGSVAGPLITAVMYRAWPDLVLPVMGWSLMVTAVLLAVLFTATSNRETWLESPQKATAL